MGRAVPAGRHRVADGRQVQLDSLGWVLWATWFLHQEAPRAANLETLWPMVRRAADRTVLGAARGRAAAAVTGLLGTPGLQRAGPARPDPRCVRADAGRAAGRDLPRLRARRLRPRAEWRRAADRLQRGIERRFAPYGYPRSPFPGGKLDSSITFLAPPFAPPSPSVLSAVTRVGERLRLPTGGVVPGEGYGADVAWTPETGLFALASAASGDVGTATGWLDWLIDHRTSLGSFPEKVGRHGDQAGVAPLGWTSALVVLALTARNASCRSRRARRSRPRRGVRGPTRRSRGWSRPA